jgi:nitroimidazol reductase NimA-like FMN-containing flavoprotein (pyridoxamine 5'-phosphate oxidase superfamily)
MAGRDSQPYAIPLPFCWRDEALYLRLPLTGRKGQVLSENDRVCFEVDQFSETLDEYASVLIEGRLVPVTDLGEKARVKQSNDEKYNRLRKGFRPGHGRVGDLSRLPMRKIVTISISGRRKS